MARLTLHLLGGFTARSGSGHPLSLGTRKARALIAYLAVPAGRAHSRDKLASLLWGDTADEQARQSLRQALVVLRRALPSSAPVLVVGRDSLALDPAAVEVDVQMFERLAAEAGAKALDQAAACYQGDLLEGFRVSEDPFEEWLRVERARLRQLAVEVLTRLLADQTKAGDTARAVHTAARLLALDPAQEAVHRALMRLYARQGRRGEALRQYQVCVGVLQRELRAEPEAETKHLYRELLQHGMLRPPVPKAMLPRGPRTPTRSAVAAAPALEGRLIGREVEMKRMRRAWTAARQGRGQVVILTGDAGIGKTRLLAEVAAEATRQGGRVVLGPCYESEQILPYGPWVNALRAGGVIGDEAVLGPLDPVWRAELGKLVPEVAETRGPEPTGDRLRLFESVVHLVKQLASAGPIVLGLEDLHWADELSLRLLAFAVRRLRGAPVLIVATAREDEPGSGEALRMATEELGREAHCASLTLAPLSRAETAALVETLAPERGEAAAMAEQVWAVSEGNPFVAVVTMNALREGSIAAAPTPGPSVPARIRELIGRRVERLSLHGQELAAVAAVIGREFEFALLQRASGLREREAAQGVEELVRRRVLHGVGERFDFTHDRVRGAIASGLLAPRRKVLHGQVASAIEELYASRLESYTTALGLHYLRAEAWGQAATYLLQSGRAARWRVAIREAVSCLNYALEALDHLPASRSTGERTADVRLELGKAYASSFDERRFALGHLREAEHLATDLDDQPRLGRVLIALSGELWLLGEGWSAVEVGQRALAIGVSIGDVAIQVGARSPLGRGHHLLGNFSEARRLYEESLLELSDPRARESLRLRFMYADASSWLAWSLAELGEFALGLARAAEAVDICRIIGRADGLARALYGVGLLHHGRGDIKAAIPVLEEALAMCRLCVDLPIYVAPTEAHLGLAYALAGRLAEGLPLLERSVLDSQGRAMTWSQSLWSGWLAEALLMAGRVDDATTTARRALDLAVDRQERDREAYARRILGEVASREGPRGVAEAVRQYNQATSLAETLGMRPLVAHCHLGLGRLHRGIGARQEAREHLASAAAMYREMGMVSWPELAQAELAGAS